MFTGMLLIFLENLARSFHMTLKVLDALSFFFSFFLAQALLVLLLSNSNSVDDSREC